MPSIKAIAVAFLMSFCLASAPAPAEDLMASAVALYNAGRFGEAIVRFRVIVRLEPNSIAGHYYLGLCYQRVKSTDQAIEEFKWVLLHARDQRVCQMAGQALMALDRRGASGVATLVSRGPRAWSPSAQNTPAAVAPDSNKRLRRVINLYQPNTGSALEFNPVFEDVKAKYSGIEFVSYDRSDPLNAEMVQKYKAETEVTLVYIDVSGKVMKIVPGAPTRTFEKEIADLAVGRRDSYWSGATVANAPVNPAPSSSAASRVPKAKPLKKVVEFFKPGSPFHTEFLPTFEEAKARFVNIQFVSLTKFDPLYAEVAKRYGLDSEIGVVYFDGSGNVLLVHNGILNINQLTNEISTLMGGDGP